MARTVTKYTISIQAIAFLVCVCLGDITFADRATISAQGNEYKGLLVAIHHTVPEEERLIDRIKAVFTEGSEYLFTASQRRIFWKDITILIPKTWSTKPEYLPAKGESFERAHVIVDKPNPEWGNNPYTHQLGGCGKKGEYIHLTPTYLLDKDTSEYIWGPAGRLLIHEWGHLRYGLFDEYFTSYEDPGVKPFYLDRREELQGTRCSLEMRGINRNGVSFAECTINRRTGLPVEGCLFFPDLEGQTASASIMFAQYLDPVVSWCHNDKNDPSGHHNREAPNKHNNMCSGKSALEVILESEDFAGTKNLPLSENEIVKTTPNFRLIQRRERRVVLVLDVSTSMSGEPLRQLLQVCGNYIRNTVDDGSYIGVVDFAGTARALVDLMLISDSNSRELIIANLPKYADGPTSIGAGIRKGIEVLSELDEFGATGGYLLLVSDGVENTAPFIEDVWDEIASAGVVIDTVAFSSAADRQLESIASMTGGFSFFYSGKEDTSALYDAFTSTITKRPDESINALPIQLNSGAVKIPSKAVTRGYVFLDATLGNSTLFTFTWTTNQIGVVVTSPDGNTIDESDAEKYTVDITMKMISIRIPGTAQSGKWTYAISNRGGSSEVSNVAITSKRVSDDVQPVTLTSHLGSTRVDYDQSRAPVIIYAEVTKGYQPVINVSVTATINNDDGYVEHLRLNDNGAGSDVTKNDGVYSAYYFNFTGNGRNGVQIKVDNANGVAKIRKSSGASGGAFPRGIEGRKPDTSYEDAELFNRATSAGTFEVTGYVDSNEQLDIFAPARIMDLEIISTSHEDRTVSMQWTATGNDFDQGTAMLYDLRFSDDIDVIYDDFDNATSLDNDDVVKGDLMSPLTAGSTERITVRLSKSVNSATNRVSFAIRAVDETANRGEPSNVVTTTFYVPENNNVVIIVICVIIVLLILLAIVVVAVIIIYRRKRTLNKRSKLNDEKAPAQRTTYQVVPTTVTVETKKKKVPTATLR